MDGTPEAPIFDYTALLREAILGVVRNVLARTADQGLPGNHHFFLTFDTAEPGVELPPRQRQQYPHEMTIALQHQFWNLAVDEGGFSVTLRFGGRPERVRVPWSALRVFADPSVGFALRLPSGEASDDQPAADAGPGATASPRSVDPPSFRPRAVRGSGSGPTPLRRVTDRPAEGGAEAPKVVDLGAFRRRSEDRPQD